MKASLFLASTGALLAMAGPLQKRVMETEVVVEVVTVTVTAGSQPTVPVFVDSPAIKENPVQAPPTSRRARPQRPRPSYAAPAPAPEPSVIIVTTRIQPAPAPQPTVEPQPEPVQPKPSSSAAPAPSPAPPAENKPDTSSYEGMMVEQHNIHRRNHSAPDLVWDSTLAQYAANTANGCVFAHDMNQGGGGYGQNLASWGSSGDIGSLKDKTAAGGVTNQWYNSEVENWQFYGAANPPASSDLHLWGHFTQVVWKGSQKVGCATVQCPAGTVLGLNSWYTVCNYEPAGNFGGQYGDNVLRPQGAAIATV
ncbi:CAP domain-containing protein [Stachybotrys elegans]|uniref:CAP domain-containing protein n=1 Tax=Stachybotrys elegans TaxID=80388 RepID=A0A8K0SPN0_9HYPO|nr:CAP domain-containing protein [Stachybotrys elegans]